MNLKTILLFSFILVSISSISASTLSNSPLLVDCNSVKEIADLEEQADDIHENYEKLDLFPFEQEYNRFKELVSTYKKDPSEELKEKINQSFEKIQFFDSVYNEVKRYEEDVSNTYFELSAMVFNYERRVSKQYTDNREAGGHYGGAAKSFAVIQKKNLYEPAMKVYNAKMLELKNAFMCEYETRIFLLRENLELLKKLEKLRYDENTRELEKELKRLDDPKIIEEKIMNYQMSE